MIWLEKINRFKIINATLAANEQNTVLQKEIQERKLAEAGKSSAELMLRNRERKEEEMRLAKEAADSANLMKSEFLATMSHELRTPMHGILGTIGLMLGADLSPAHRKHIDTIKQSGDALLHLLNSILDLSKIEAGRLVLEEVKFRLGPLLDSVDELMGSRARQKGLGFDIKLEPDIPEALKGDPDRTRQILINLVGNAIKFTEVGAITVHLSQTPLDEHRSEIRFEVSDSGIGLDDEQQHRIFDRFAQADGSTTRKFGGTGLGLAISKELALLMGGSIGVRSNPDRGCSFWFTARYDIGVAANTDDQAQARRSDEPTETTKSRPLRILVAEDNPVNQLIAAETLESASHHVDVVSNGVEALEAVKAYPYDLILMDISMPEMDGLIATKRIRQIPGEASRIPIIALTADAMSGDREKYLSAGMDDYLSKPFETNELFKTIKRCVDRAQTAIGLDHAVVEPLRVGKPDLCKRLIRIYLETTPARLGTLERALTNDDCAAVQLTAHTLKSSCANLGAVRLSDLCRQLESAAESGNLDSGPALFAEIRSEYEIVSTTLEGDGEGDAIAERSTA